MENWIVASSNAPVIMCIYYAWCNRDFISSMLLAFVGFASFVSHLVENHKHGMPGAIKVSQSASLAWNTLDKIGVFLCVVRGIQLFWNHIPSLWLLICMGLSLLLNLISESDKTPATKTRFIILHCAWHVTIFGCIAIYLKQNI